MWTLEFEFYKDIYKTSAYQKHILLYISDKYNNIIMCLPLIKSKNQCVLNLSTNNSSIISACVSFGGHL